MYFLNFALCIISQENNITHCLASVCVFSSDPFTPNEGFHTTFLFLTKRNNTKKGKNGTLSVKTVGSGKPHSVHAEVTHCVWGWG